MLVFVGRKIEIGRIKAALKDGRNCIVIGKSGVGKTALLRLFCKGKAVFMRNPRSPRLLLQRLCAILEIENRKGSSEDLLEAVLEAKYNGTVKIVLDNFSTCPVLTLAVLKELSQLDCIWILAAAEYKPRGRVNWIFKERMFINPLGKEESKKLAEKFLGKKVPEEQLYNRTHGYPAAILEAVEEMKKKGVRKGLDKLKPHPVTRQGRIDLLPAEYLAALAYFLLFVRYVALGEGSDSLFIAAGALGFIALAFSKLGKR